jgi:WD40 repeat protein
VGWNNGDLSIIDLDGRKVSTKWPGHDGAVTSLAFSASGQLLVSSAQDGTVKVWDRERHEVQLTIVTSFGNNQWAAVAPNGLFDGGRNGWSRFVWRFGNNVFDTLPTEVYFREFFHPGLVAQVFTEKCISASRQPAGVSPRN